MRDVKALVREVVGLDWPYLEEWAMALGLSHRLEEARLG